MTIETVITCPLGAKCEEIKDGKMHRCAWFLKLAGLNPNTGEMVDDNGCSMNWMPILLIENSKQQRSTASAVESFRNEMMASNDQARLALETLAGPKINTQLLEG